jgi:hypothetical protein
MVAQPDTSSWCSPRWATRRTDRPSLGPAVARVAAMLGTPFMPWQQYVADVAFELDEDGRLAYREVVLTVPRQSGKTTLLLAVAIHRALATQHFGPRQVITYTAQTGKDANRKWREEFVEGGLDQASGLRGKYQTKLNPGREHVRFRNGSRFGPEATTEKAGHGGTVDVAFIDEAFAQVDGRVEQAFRPAMITRHESQLWVNSTAGWLGGSPYLWSKVDAGRVAAEAGVTEDSAYFEWSADPDDDPEDPATWWSCMPALGHTITERDVRMALNGMRSSPEGLNGFRRAFLNLWVPKDAPAEQVIPADAWLAAKVPAIDWRGPYAACIDTTPERDWTAIGVAQGGERASVEVTDLRQGTWWVVKRAIELDESLGRPEWLIDARSPAMSLVPELEAAGLTVRTTGPADMAGACGQIYDRTMRGLLEHVGQPEITAALAGAKRRDIGDAWGWARKGAANLAPLVAITLAQWGVVTAPPVSPLTLPRSIDMDRDPNDVMSLNW